MQTKAVAITALQAYGFRVANNAQAQMWDTTGAEAWIRHVDDFDATLNPFGRAVMDGLALRSGERILDIGCGVGSTSMELASRVEPGHVTGADISPRMVAEATRRATERGIVNVDFVAKDVQTGDLGSDYFDVAFSRVGVMFFDDPVQAFTNIRSAIATGGRLGFICFQDPTRNPFISQPVMAALAHLEVSPPAPGGPSPFALADPDHIREILNSAGFTNIRVDPGPDEAVIPAGAGLDAVARRLLEQNPLTAGHMAGLPDEKVASLINAVAEVLRPFSHGDEIRMGAGTWLVFADKPS